MGNFSCGTLLSHSRKVGCGPATMRGGTRQIKQGGIGVTYMHDVALVIRLLDCGEPGGWLRWSRLMYGIKFGCNRTLAKHSPPP